MNRPRTRTATHGCMALVALMLAWFTPAHAGPSAMGPQGKPSRAMGCSLIEGTWFHSGKGIPITARGDRLIVNMSALRRPTANGRILSDSQIEVNFPDDATYTGTLDGQGQIRWSNGTAWQATQFAGTWYFDGRPGPTVTHVGNRLKVSMASYGRPQAQGTVTGPSTANVSFPDDASHSALLVSPTCMQWSNGTVWTK